MKKKTIIIFFIFFIVKYFSFNAITCETFEKIFTFSDAKVNNLYNTADFFYIQDDLCDHLINHQIIGPISSSFFRVETYVYDVENNSSFKWQVNGGEILNGQGTNTILVKWGVVQTGLLSVIEIDDQCYGPQVDLNVDLNANNLPVNISIARLWNEVLLYAIRRDYARPTVHARNLFHSAVVMYDIWAIYDELAQPYLVGNTINDFNSALNEFNLTESKEVSIDKAISFAMYRLLSYRFQNSPSNDSTQALLNFLMNELDYDLSYSSLTYEDGNAASLGNYVAQIIIDYGLQDGSREATGYDNAYYEPVNTPLVLDIDNNSQINDPNRWQPLAFDTFIDQSGNLIDGDVPPFQSPEWGNVSPFALTDEDKITYEREGNQYHVYHDPSDPAYLSLIEENIDSNFYKWGFSLVSVWQSHLDPSDSIMIDISPNSIGNIDSSDYPTNYLEYSSFYDLFGGGSLGVGYSVNPFTSNPYETNLVPRGDYTRVIAEFWADGPDSETPPGHWFTILNYINDHPDFEKRFQGQGDIVSALEWDVKSYFILGGGMHDSAIAAWSIKGWYDYIRPISAIRSMALRGQSSDPNLGNYDTAGIPLLESFIEVIEPGDPLAGSENQFAGEIKLYTWKGHNYVDNNETGQAGVGWIRASDWYPYQRPTFVTPPFAGYVSGHSTFSSAAAELLTMITGSEYFPGGLGQYTAKANEFLVFEDGPSVDVTLQWATYKDAADQTSLSRIWGGIHPTMDDIPGRIIGKLVAQDAFDLAIPYFNGNLSTDDLTHNKILIFPNPSKGHLNILNFKIDDIISLFDLTGRSINFSYEINDYENKIKTIFIDVDSGIYLLNINSTSYKVIIE